MDTACGKANETVHLGAAVLVFGSLLWLCLIFRKRALEKFEKTQFTTAWIRSHIYEGCIGGIVIGALLVGLYKIDVKVLGETSFFWGEALMLFAFSIAWLTASKIIIPDAKRPTLLPR